MAAPLRVFLFPQPACTWHCAAHHSLSSFRLPDKFSQVNLSLLSRRSCFFIYTPLRFASLRFASVFSPWRCCCNKMADLRDEHGNPLQLTDEHGNPVHLTDEHGNPMSVTGVAIQQQYGTESGLGGAQEQKHRGAEAGPEKVMDVEGNEEIQRSGSSSSSSSEDDGQGGRRKKKGLKQKIKEKLMGSKQKDELVEPTSTTMGSATPVSVEGGEHEKKSMMEKIKEKLPGHHTQ